MTDNEIIKALECCSNETALTCKGCPLVETQKHCTPIVSKNALDLINRQKTEIESLKIANKKMYQACKEQESIQERECPTCYGTGKLHTSDWLVKGITKEQLAKEKEEAMREAIDFFKKEAIKAYEDKILELFPCDKIFTTISRFTVKKIAKEMTEGEKE